MNTAAPRGLLRADSRPVREPRPSHRAANPRGPTPTARSRLRSGPIVGTLAILAILALTCPSSPASTENRDIVFELDPGRSYPDLELEMLKVITVDGFIGNSGHRLHLPGKLTLSYDPNDIHPGGTAPLTFTFDPIDGPGLEYDMERGVAFGIDVKVWDWGFKYGDDFEEDFVPPVGSSQSHTGYDQTVEIWGKSVRCAGGISFGLFTRESFEGDVVRIPLRITEPSGGIGVKFAETNSDFVELQFTSPGGSAVATLDISIIYLGLNISVAVEDPRFELVQTEGLFEPGVEGWVVDPDLPWDPCNQKSKTLTVAWPGAPTNTNRSIPADLLESDGLSFRFKNKFWPWSFPMVQDLAVSSYRLSDLDEPELGGVDPIVSVIRNVHGDICSGYEQITLDYWVVDGATELPIGSLMLAPGDPILEDFNTGITDQMTVVFNYDESSPNYILDGEHRWEGTDPLYRVRMAAEPQPPCPDWELGDEPPLTFDNDEDGIPYALPLPDFAIDSLIVDSHQYVQFGDTLRFEVRVSNRGVLWPPPQLPEPPPIVVDCRVSYERRTPAPEWVEIVYEYMGQQVLTPIDRHQQKYYTFEYIVPLEQDLQNSFPLDRLRFNFEAQDGSLPLGPLTWDRNYENNTLSAEIFITDFPDLSLASTQAFSQGDSIVTSMPYYCSEPAPCNRPIFLYVNDGKLVYTPPDAPPLNLRVWLGVGPYESSPKDPTWIWFPCNFKRDFTDDRGKQYKVFQGNLCWLNLPIVGKRSYCFRSSLDFTDDHPTYAYVDKDGTSTIRDAENLYYLDQAGTIDWPCHCFVNGPGVAGVGFPVPFDAAGSEGVDGQPILSYEWSFGDGTFGDGFAVDHAYDQVGGYDVQLCILDILGMQQCCTHSLNVTTGTGHETPDLPTELALHPARPNPFNPTTTIRFDLPADGPVRLEIFDARGRLVAVLADAWVPAGRREIIWDGRDDSGRRVESGVFLLRLNALGERHTGSVVLLK